jgi:hypothetical protein
MAGVDHSFGQDMGQVDHAAGTGMRLELRNFPL